MSHKSGVYTRDGRSNGDQTLCTKCPRHHYVGTKGFAAHVRNVKAKAVTVEVASEQVGSQQWDPAAARKAANMAKAHRFTAEMAE